MYRSFVSFVQPSDLKHSMCFDPVNTGKLGVTLDIKSSVGIAALKHLLRDCDVFVTNVRLDALRRAGLHYDQLHREFPTLVYVSLTAWGSHGPDANLPGYDLGAFYHATGFGNACQIRPGNFNVYIPGMGDLQTGSVLAAQTAAALLCREQSGKGQLVTTSLLKTGYWVMSASLTAATANDTGKAPNYAAHIASQPPLRSSYRTRDNVLVQLVADKWPGVDEKDAAAVAARVAKLNEAELDVTHVVVPEFAQLLCTDCPSPDFVKAEVFQPSPPGTQCNQRLMRIPIDWSCHPHRAAFRPPWLGEHTEDVLRNGWSPREERKTSFGSGEMRAPFSGKVVVELTDGANWVPEIVGGQLFELGATVFQTRPAALPQNNRGKQQIAENAVDLSKCDILVTNRLEDEKRLPELRRTYPKLIILCVSPFGTGGRSEPRSSLGAFTAASGIGLLLGQSADPKQITSFAPHVGDHICGIHGLLGVNFAMYHLVRTGEGQLVEVNLLRSGYYSMMASTYPIAQCGVMPRLAPSVEVGWEYHPLPCANAFRTKDGWYVCLLGADIARHMTKTLRAFGLGKAYYAKMAAVFLKNIRQEKLYRIQQVMCQLNRDLAAIFETKTLDEWRPIFAEHDIWHTLVNTEAEAKAYGQAHEIGIFKRAGEVNTPMRFYGGWQEH